MSSGWRAEVMGWLSAALLVVALVLQYAISRHFGRDVGGVLTSCLVVGTIGAGVFVLVKLWNR